MPRPAVATPCNAERVLEVLFRAAGEGFGRKARHGTEGEDTKRGVAKWQKMCSVMDMSGPT